MRFRNLGLKTKITATAIIPILLVIILTTVGVFSLRELLKVVDYVEHTYKMMISGMKIQNTARDMRTALDTFLLTKKEAALEPFKQAEKEVASAVDVLKAQLTTPSQKNMLSEAQEALDRWKKDVVEPSIKSRRPASNNNDWEKFDQSMNAFAAKERSLLAEREAAGHALEALTEMIIIFGTIILIIITLPLCYLVARSITKPLSEAVGLAENIAGGDLSQTLMISGTDEVGTLSAALNHMVASLRDQSRKTAEGTNVLASSAAEISTSVAQLASSAAETASAITETVTTVEELDQTTKLCAEKAKRVAESAHQAVQIADSGEKAIEDTIERINAIKGEMESIGETVQRLSEQSQSVEEIVNSVRDLADQSNLLAVNASIEAAKAGEQGKGFGVVANEIKILADRSREATDQIRIILEDTSKWIGAVVMATEQGAKAVKGCLQQSRIAGESIRTLCKSVEQSAESASVIQASNEQQAVGVGQVSNAMSYIDQAMRQNVSGATQLEEAARQISDLGHSLKELVERYKM